MNLGDFGRLLNPIKRKLFLMVGNALLTAVNNTGAVGFYPAGDRKNPQRVSMNWLGPLTGIEHSQPYGFESHPVVGTAKGIILSPDGSRSNAFVVMVQDDEYRPDDLDEGASCQYDNSDGRHVISEGKHAIGKKDTLMASTPPAADTELLEIIDRYMAIFEGVINLPGTASGASLLATVTVEIGKLRADLANIKGTL